MLLLSLALPTFAAPEAEAPVDVTLEGRMIKYRERDEINFLEGLELEGELIRPGVIGIQERGRPRFNPLIQLRTDWNREAAASIDEVK